jgi:hypothetical protein
LRGTDRAQDRFLPEYRESIMPAGILIGLGAFALLSGPICGGIQWHHWNRARGRNFWTRRVGPKSEEEFRGESKNAAA